jgi:bifunctional DNA-binding transcriptional regulator/antitoxin component of YhaV-PrlF toxin-antitoxin module
MARRPIEEQSIRKLNKVGRGRTISVTLPIELIRELGWREKQKVVVKKRGQGLLIEDWKA